jgi:hypothetical protein
MDLLEWEHVAHDLEDENRELSNRLETEHLAVLALAWLNRLMFERCIRLRAELERTRLDGPPDPRGRAALRAGS